MRNLDTLRWPTDDGLQGFLTESLRDELEHHNGVEDTYFRLNTGARWPNYSLPTDEWEDAQKRERRGGELHLLSRRRKSY